MEGCLIGLLCSTYFKNRCTFSPSLQFIVRLYPHIEGSQPRLTPLYIYAVSKPGVTRESTSMSLWLLPPSRADVPGHPAKRGQTVASHGSSWVCKYKPVSCILNKDSLMLLAQEITKSHEGTYASEPSSWEEKHAAGLSDRGDELMRDAMKKKPEWRGKHPELNLKSIVWVSDHPRVPQLSLLCGLLFPTPSSRSLSPSPFCPANPSQASHRRMLGSCMLG